MTGNRFGKLFSVTTAGESHGPANVVIIDGCPPGLPLSEEDLQPDLDRRRPGQSKITTQRREPDKAIILSGVFKGKTTGTALAIMVENADQRSKDYSNIAQKYRPGHADYTYDQKYGFRDFRGGGRASARETVARVAAGAVARKILQQLQIEVVGFVSQVGEVEAHIAQETPVTQAMVEANIARCPDPVAAEKMIALIDRVRKDQDSIGGIAEIRAYGVPPGVGEPVFDKLKAALGHGILSIPAVTGFEYGNGFDVATMRGSENNDHFRLGDGQIDTATNRHGGMLGGITSGKPIVVRAAVKPTSSLSKPQPTVDAAGQETTIATKGRHDPCLLPRFVPIGEAMVMLTLVDQILRFRGQCPETYAKAFAHCGAAPL